MSGINAAYMGTVSDKTWHNTNAARYEIRVDTGGSFYLRGCCYSTQCPSLNSNGFKKSRCKQLRQIWQEKSRIIRRFLEQSPRGCHYKESEGTRKFLHQIRQTRTRELLYPIW